ncbi:hypothetical protein EJ05DRAFT_512329 [Pseudovirgaria hyperparasitica]|uniref:Uncharacterized protein n=1 Tax=Pseudovirgaria hyperparasitica TaxID=470096 RepID=A0A6A6W2A9_9PEZI|nr:uncharacterized protein EJ05DRAFT_512329 [Pseudovirgaria hyperparasitica]KAF2756703.1 hypothetical protein EJ05DRAFT_512329 [Pseudovirgaria hyperparasitica]
MSSFLPLVSETSVDVGHDFKAEPKVSQGIKVVVHEIDDDSGNETQVEPNLSENLNPLDREVDSAVPDTYAEYKPPVYSKPGLGCPWKKNTLKDTVPHSVKDREIMWSTDDIAELEANGPVMTPAMVSDLALRIMKSGEKLKESVKEIEILEETAKALGAVVARSVCVDDVPNAPVDADASNKQHVSKVDVALISERPCDAPCSSCEKMKCVPKGDLPVESILTSAEEPYFDKVREVQHDLERVTLEDVKILAKLETQAHGHIEKGGETAKLQSIVDSRHRFEKSFEDREANFERVKHEIEEKEEHDPSSVTKSDAAKLAHYEARAHGTLEAGGPAAWRARMRRLQWLISQQNQWGEYQDDGTTVSQLVKQLEEVNSMS